MQTEPKKASPQEKSRSSGGLLRAWKEKLKAWRECCEAHPDLFTLNIQAGVRKLAGRIRAVAGKLRRLSAQKKAYKFPESEHRAAQLFLFLIGSLPRRGAQLREKLLRRRKWHIDHGGKRRALLDRFRLHPAVFLSGALAVAALAVALSLYTVGVTVQYDGISLGAVANRRTVTAAVAELEEITRTTLNDADYAVDADLLQSQRHLVARKELETGEEFRDRLCGQLGLVAYGYVLYIDGEPIAATPHSDALDELLEQMKTGYITPNTVDCYFKEAVEIRQEYIDASYMTNLGYIAQRLNDTKQDEVTYTVKSGDAWSEIAENNDMSNKELLALNPGYDINNIHIGDVLTVTRAVPYLTIVDVERQNYVKDIPYKIKYKNDSSMYEGDYKVISAGKYGKADVTANVTYINGGETDREVVASVTRIKPVAEQRLRGTKKRPTWMPTGNFQWPCSGGITSDFGYRDTGIPGASTYHEGIDISDSYGTPICASDGGTVSYAGWMSGYGYLVIIDHGNGYETYYGHNSSLLVSEGEHVFQGQQIACMGSTGISSGDHCHFGVMKNGTFVNPLNYLS
ncbi:MAG: M23 family metallopeptidase [Clostridiales bacterium]|nr:M23 family metallopeptidase [Candidatus Cacconaster stercorequi]